MRRMHHILGPDFLINPCTFDTCKDGYICINKTTYRRDLDHELDKEHEIVLTLTDNQLGTNKFITQSLLILVEDANDNPPRFAQPQISVTVNEHVPNTILATLYATDRDSGAFGQVIIHTLYIDILKAFGQLLYVQEVLTHFI